MNEAAREVLVAAALRGHRQIRFMNHHPSADTGECALGVLHLTMHETRQHALMCEESQSFPCFLALRRRYGLDAARGKTSAYMAISNANDVLGWDFLTIATKLGVPQEAP